MNRKDIIDAAMAYEGVPWRHMGRSKKGVDCVGLVVCVARDLGLVPSKWDTISYGMNPDGTLIPNVRQYLRRVPRSNLQAGNILVFNYDGSDRHLGIMLNPANRTFIHSYRLTGRVSVSTLSGPFCSRRCYVSLVYDFKDEVNG